MSNAHAVAQPAVFNGVNVTALTKVIKAVQANPDIAKFNFRATNRWMGGEKNRSSIKTFTGALQEQRSNAQGFFADTGEPPVLLGEDKAPNSAEWLLHSLIGCITTSAAYHAAARGVEIKAIESDLDGDLDLRGFLGLSPDVRKGYSAIRVRMRVKTDASADTIKACASMSPMLEMVSKATPVAFSVETY